MKIALLFALAPSAILAQASAKINVGPNVHVSRSMSDAMHDETLIAVDPADPSRLIACSIYEPSHGKWGQMTVVYTSSDAGKTWSRPLIVDSITADTSRPWPVNSVDPTCTFGINGRMLFSRIDPIRPYWSDDGGKTWNRATIPTSGWIDRDFLVVDHTGGKYRGRVYLYAQMTAPGLDAGAYLGSAITLWRSLDGGQTYERPIQRHPPPDQPSSTAFHPGMSVVLSDGTWAAVMNQLLTDVFQNPTIEQSARIKVITSTDGGETLNPAITVATAYNGMHVGNTMPMMAADTRSASFKDRMYVIWADLIAGRFRLVLAYSSDRGATWSSPRVVSDDLAPPPGTEPEKSVGRLSVAVNPSGVVGVIWEDRRNNKVNDRGFEMRFAASLDGGDTWTPSVVISEKPNREDQTQRWQPSATASDWGPNTSFEVTRQTAGYHTIGLAADRNGLFHAIWTDNRTGISQVYTTTVSVEGPVAKFGDPSLAKATDLSNKIKIDVLGSAYDPASQRLTVRTRLRNLSTDTIRGTLAVRALLVRSEATTTGIARILGADNGIGGPGALWDFTKQMPNGRLAPRDSTADRVFTFELSPQRPIGPGHKFGRSALPFHLVNFDGQVIGLGPP